MGMLTRPKLMLPFQIARIRNDYFARRAGFARMKRSILSGGAHAPSRIWSAATCRRFKSADASALQGIRPLVRVPGAGFRAARKGGSKFLRLNYSDRKRPR